MEKQQEQTKQNPNQEVEYISGFLEEEEVNESEFDEPAREQEKVCNLAENQQGKPVNEEEPKKRKRPRKTLEQEIAELDAKRERLMEKERRQEAHEKIVFGATVIAMLKDMKKRDDRNVYVFCKSILAFTMGEQSKTKDIISKIISEII